MLIFRLALIQTKIKNIAVFDIRGYQVKVSVIIEMMDYSDDIETLRTYMRNSVCGTNVSTKTP